MGGGGEGRRVGGGVRGGARGKGKGMVEGGRRGERKSGREGLYPVLSFLSPLLSLPLSSPSTPLPPLPSLSPVPTPLLPSLPSLPCPHPHSSTLLSSHSLWISMRAFSLFWMTMHRRRMIYVCQASHVVQFNNLGWPNYCLGQPNSCCVVHNQETIVLASRSLFRVVQSSNQDNPVATQTSFGTS